MSRQVMIEALDGRRMMYNWMDGIRLGGDFNYDGIVDLSKFTKLASNFGVDGDRNADNVVDSADFDYIRTNADKFANGARIANSAGFGDANFDGRVDKYDIRQIGANFNQNFSISQQWSRGDFTMNGRVELRDFALAVANAAGK